MKSITTLLLLFIVIHAQAELRTLTDIESSLDPLEFVDNYDGIRRSIDLDIRFALASAVLSPNTMQQLDVLGEAMSGQRLSKYRFNVIGHTDASGDAEVNLQLSKGRAASVKIYLMETFAIADERLITIGKGETALKKNTSPTDPSQRRVEITAEVYEGADSQSPPSSDENTVSEDGKVDVQW